MAAPPPGRQPGLRLRPRGVERHGCRSHRGHRCASSRSLQGVVLEALFRADRHPAVHPLHAVLLVVLLGRRRAAAGQLAAGRRLSGRLGFLRDPARYRVPEWLSDHRLFPLLRAWGASQPGLGHQGDGDHRPAGRSQGGSGAGETRRQFVHGAGRADRRESGRRNRRDGAWRRAKRARGSDRQGDGRPRQWPDRS